MKRFGRGLATAGAACAMLMAWGCSKPAAQQAAAPPAPAGATPAPAGAAAPVGGPEMEQIRAKMLGVKSYEMTISSDGKDVTMLAKLDGGKAAKMKMTVSSDGDWMLHDVSAKTAYMYSAKDKVITKMTMSGDPKSSRLPSTVTQGADGLADKKPKISSDKLDGLDCWKLDVEDKDQGNSTLWLDKEYGLVRQVKNGDKVTKMTYKQINKVPDSAFELPKGATVKDMGNMADMMKGMGGAMPPGHGGGAMPGHGEGAMPGGHGEGGMPPGHPSMGDMPKSKPAAKGD